jgi:hypothetical protein
MLLVPSLLTCPEFHIVSRIYSHKLFRSLTTAMPERSQQNQLDEFRI